MDKPLSVRPYKPSNPDGPFPYSQQDMTPMDPGNDTNFYAPPRFVTHIDDNAIANLTKYYDENLPKQGRILDFCSSWVSHYPSRIAEAVREKAAESDTQQVMSSEGRLEVWGTGMNATELSKNVVLNIPTGAAAGSKGTDGTDISRRWWVQDLNTTPFLTPPVPQGASEQQKNLELDVSTCVVSIDYLTKPVEVLRSIRDHTKTSGTVHLVISNRCFPTKVVRRWLRIDEAERLEMVGDYLHWAGWEGIEIVDVVKGGFMTDPLWVVRGRNGG